MTTVHVTKYSGHTETYDESKLRQSLKNAGTPDYLIDETVSVVNDKLFDGITTQEIYKTSLKYLQNFSKRSAGRYRLKEALFELGPQGVFFEKFIIELLKRLGYETEVGVTVLGHCITHDIDVIAYDEDAYNLVECKFYNRDGERCNVKVPLYFQSRFQDLKMKRSNEPESDNKIYKGWIITNTRFTYQAEEYGKCVGLKLLSWDFPRKRGIKELVEYLNLYPVSCLSSLTKEEKNRLFSHDIIFCKQIGDDENHLESAGINPKQIDRISKEAEEICSK